MGKNTFQSLVMAASMLGMSANSATAQGSGDQITETKNTIEALISSLPPDQFKAAITVLEGDKALLDDGTMDTKDTSTIRDHASKLLGISKDAAQKVLDSLNPRGVVPSTKEAGVVKKSEPKIGATPAEKKEMEAQQKQEEQEKKALDKILADLNKNFFEKENWKSTNSKGADAEIKTSKGAISTKFISKGAKGPTSRSTAYMETMLLPNHTYQIELGDITGNGKIGIKLLDSSNKLTPLQMLQKGFNTVTLPSNYKNTAIFEIENNALDGELSIKGFKITIQEENKVAIGQ